MREEVKNLQSNVTVLFEVKKKKKKRKSKIVLKQNTEE